DEHALLARRLAFQHLRPFDHARVLLGGARVRNTVVPGAAWIVVTVAADRRTGLIREEGAEELVTIVGTERIRADADRGTHRAPALRARLAARTAAALRVRLLRRSGRRCRRLEERRRRSRLPLHANRADVRRLSALPFTRLIRAGRSSPEDRHDDQPPIRQLIVADDGITVVARFARAAESPEHVVRVHRT